MLWSNVARSSKSGECSGEVTLFIKPFGEAEIAHERFAAAVEQDVSRFEVAVGDLGEGAEFGGGGFGGLADDGEGVGAEERRAAGEEVEQNGAEAVDIGGGF